MIVSEIYELRKQGRTEEAFKSICSIYAVDKGPRTSRAMFWCAVDMLKLCINEQRYDEALKIFLALKRLFPRVPDENGWVADAFNRCVSLMSRHHLIENETPTCSNQPHSVDYGKAEIGAWGEEVAEAYLRGKGYVILERDWHSGHRDIDIIAQRDNLLVFVEVKTRSNNECVNPVVAVGYRKQRNLRLAMNHYVKFKHIDTPFRFDVITVVGSPYSVPQITHIEDFALSMR